MVLVILSRYSLELTDLQVVVGKIKDNWRHIHHRGSTKLHLIDKFSITLQLERLVGSLYVIGCRCSRELTGEFVNNNCNSSYS